MKIKRQKNINTIFIFLSYFFSVLFFFLISSCTNNAQINNISMDISLKDYINSFDECECFDEMAKYINIPYIRLLENFGSGSYIQISDSSNRDALEYFNNVNRIGYSEEITSYSFLIKDDGIDIDKTGYVWQVGLSKEGYEVIGDLCIGDTIESFAFKTGYYINDIQSPICSYSINYEQNISINFEFYEGRLVYLYLTKFDNKPYVSNNDPYINESYKELEDICNYYLKIGDYRYNIKNFEFDGSYYFERVDKICYAWKNINFELKDDVAYIIIEPDGEKKAYLEFKTNNFVPNLIWKNGKYAHIFEEYTGIWKTKIDDYMLNMKSIDKDGNFNADLYLPDDNGDIVKFSSIEGSFYPVDRRSVAEVLEADYQCLFTSHLDDSNSFNIIFSLYKNKRMIGVHSYNDYFTYFKEQLGFNIPGTQDELNDFESKTIKTYRTIPDIYEPEPEIKTPDPVYTETNTIRKADGTVVGFIDRYSNGDKVARKMDGTLAGRYYVSMDATYDGSGYLVAWGDVLTELLFEQ